jgi:hypothetical protein
MIAHLVARGDWTPERARTVRDLLVDPDLAHMRLTENWMVFIICPVTDDLAPRLVWRKS